MGRPERPIDPEEGPVQRFAWELRQLREKAGSPSYRQLARTAHFSATALSEAAGGEQLPSLAVALAYVRACDGDADEWEERWRDTAKGEACDAPPYLGLAAFGEQDADRFFGRDAVVADLVERVRNHRVVGVFGPSGSGKSSLLHAGLLPALSERVLSTTPATWPADGPGDDVDLVVVDQFEELFTHLDNPAEFVDELLAHRVVLAARADFLGHCATLPALVEALRESTVLVGPMSDDELRAAIERPAIESGLKVQPEMLATAVADVRGQPGALPLLSHALLETWRRRERGRLTLDGYRASGGVVGAIAATAERTYAQLTPEGQSIARAVLLRLVQPGGSGDLRRRAPLPEVLAAGQPEQTAHVLDVLAAARLVVVTEGRAELAHEAVTRAWPRLREWIDSDAEALRLHRDFTTAAQIWDSTDREPSSLYRGLRLAAVRELAERPEWDVSSTVLERDFLQAAVDQQHAEQEQTTRHTRRLRSLVRALAAVTVACVAVATVAVVQRQSAVREQRIAESRQIAVQAQDLSAAWPDAAAALAASAYRTAPTAEARGALLSTAAYKPVRTLLKDHRGPVRAVAFNGDGTLLATGGDDHTVLLRHGDSTPIALSRHSGAVRAVAFQPGGVLASAGDDRRIVLWDVTRHVPVHTIELDHGRVRALAFTADGAVLASASADGPVVLWRTSDWTELERVPHSLGEANGLAFSGAVLAVAGTKGVLVRDGNSTRTFTDHDAAVRTVALTADGRTMATGGDDHQVVLRDLAGGTATHLRRHVSPVWTVQFGADATKLMSASDDGGIRWWAVPGGGWLTGLITRSNAFYAAALSPDGTRLAAGGDENVSLWRQPLPPFTGHVNPPHAVAVSADGSVLATGGPDRMILLWDAAGRQTGRIDTPAPVTALAFRPDGLLVTASLDGVLALREIGGRVVRTWRATGEVTSLAVSPSGRLAVTGGSALTAWDLDSDEPGRALSGGHTGPVRAVAFRDEATAASGGADGTVLLWDVVSGRSTSVVRQDGPPVKALAFAPSALVVGDAGGEVAVWGGAGKERSLAVRGAIRSVAVSRDGTTVASAGADSLITLWRLADGAHVATLTGHTGPVNAVTFGPDELFSSGPDPRVVRWRLDPERVLSPGT